MRAALIAGAEIDFATPDEVKGIVKQALADDRVASIVLKLRNADVMPATGVAVLDLGYPPAGRVWDLRNIWVSGIDPTASVANAIAVVCIGTPPADGTLATTGLDPSESVTRFATIPNNATFNRGVATILSEEHLFVVVAGAASTTQLVAAAQVMSSNERKAERNDW